MTKTQFFFANIFAKLGLPRTQKRLLEAAGELQLLKEAQEVLGSHVWSNLKGEPQYQRVINEIELLLAEKSNLLDKAEILKNKEQDIRDQSNNRFSVPDNQHEESQLEFQQEQAKLVKLRAEQTQLKSNAAAIKREHDQTVSFINELKAATEIDTTTLEHQKKKIASLKQSFTDLKKQKIQLDNQISKSTDIMNKISEVINASNNLEQDSTAHKFRILGENNKEISTMFSRIGLIDNKIGTHYSELGKHISLDSLENSTSRDLVKPHFRMCKVMKALRASIRYNHQLGGRA